MPRKLVGDLIQAAAPLTDPSMPIDKIRKAAIDAHIPLIEEAGPDAYRYDIAEAVPGPTTELMARYAKKYQMAMVVPVHEREQAGVCYNTAAVYDNDGTYFCDGSSYFVDPRGNVIAMGSEDKDELVVAEQLP